jgi:peptidyl-prolyl cis-trans isomerase A (cyclophilin A)
MHYSPIQRLLPLLSALWFALLAAPADAEESTAPRLRVQTSMGTMVFELDAQRAPLTVRNVIQHARDKYYDGTILHRVIANFVIQGGGFTPDMKPKLPRATVANESGNGLSNRRGTVALARTNDPHTGTVQFFVNLADNRELDPQPNRWGYAVFGKVIEGMDVAEKISQVPTDDLSDQVKDVPIKAVVIEKVEVLE